MILTSREHFDKATSLAIKIKMKVKCSKMKS